MTKLTVVSGTEGKQANVHTQQTLAQGSEVAFTLQLQKASCTREGRCWGWGYGVLLGVRDMEIKVRAPWSIALPNPLPAGAVISLGRKDCCTEGPWKALPSACEAARLWVCTDGEF